MTLTVVQPKEGEYRWVLTMPESNQDLDLQSALDSWLSEHPHDSAQLWLHQVNAQLDAIARAANFAPYRDLWQLRCSLPQAPSGIHTRAFTENDINDFLRVNNRAFHWHPEQGRLTAERFRQTTHESWYLQDGFRLLHNPENRLMGFCWTKIHHDTSPKLGEIYVIALDPDFVGRGLGKALTLAGLEWLSGAGLDRAMLYVEADNFAANATYHSIGFTKHHTNRAYRYKP